MEPRTVKFVLFTAVSLACLLAGYLWRRRRGINEQKLAGLSERVHFVTVVVIFPLAGLISLWNLPIQPASLWLVVIEPVAVAAAGFGMIPLARLIRAEPRQLGVLVASGGMGNLGFTLGGYLCYVLIEPANAALAYAVEAVSLMQIAGVIFFNPILMHCGQADGPRRSLARMLYDSFVDWRALMLHTAVLGAGLAYFKVPYPVQIDSWWIKDGLFFLGGGTAYFGIGLQLRLSDGGAYLPQHGLLAVLRFAFIPLLTWIMLQAIAVTWGPLDPVAAKVMMVESFMPVALATVMLSNLFNLDVRLACSLWLVNTGLFMLVVLPGLVWWLRG
ncbi:MAG: hypothetical protein IT443_13575 [Phycisphaeraceae bacterium]|nr:hypothetical protein [Phycisphaeraceae bacterium]